MKISTIANLRNTPKVHLLTPNLSQSFTGNSWLTCRENKGQSVLGGGLRGVCVGGGGGLGRFATLIFGGILG